MAPVTRCSDPSAARYATIGRYERRPSLLLGPPILPASVIIPSDELALDRSRACEKPEIGDDPPETREGKNDADPSGQVEQIHATLPKAPRRPMTIATVAAAAQYSPAQ